MTFEEWWGNNSRDIILEAAINSDINKENDKERIVAVTAWKAAQQQWQPIETAPDKVPVILFIGGAILIGEKVSSNFWAVSPVHESYKIEPIPPARWMPLPPPPNNTKLTNEVKND